ncbi:hypothetical protein VPNG_10183 [Cytospora leucostoma]|uniref:Uncharacterized protein n=1 Tax=Cytospora leucostoma TaxID=1230097 RepID=A0A423VFG5_9PEZI|nr:hypothetical protein VPNG_10183 [Cytospora leucostoma]
MGFLCNYAPELHRQRPDLSGYCQEYGGAGDAARDAVTPFTHEVVFAVAEALWRASSAMVDVASHDAEGGRAEEKEEANNHRVAERLLALLPEWHNLFREGQDKLEALARPPRAMESVTGYITDGFAYEIKRDNPLSESVIKRIISLLETLRSKRLPFSAVLLNVTETAIARLAEADTDLVIMGRRLARLETQTQMRKQMQTPSLPLLLCRLWHQAWQQWADLRRRWLIPGESKFLGLQRRIALYNLILVTPPGKGERTYKCTCSSIPPLSLEHLISLPALSSLPLPLPQSQRTVKVVAEGSNSEQRVIKARAKEESSSSTAQPQGTAIMHRPSSIAATRARTSPRCHSGPSGGLDIVGSTGDPGSQAACRTSKNVELQGQANRSGRPPKPTASN